MTCMVYTFAGRFCFASYPVYNLAHIMSRIFWGQLRFTLNSIGT
jgi:hypothetical protein